jgi:transcriptional regulator
MKDKSTKEKFVELRAQGMSFSKIADELKTSHQTLINWSKEFAEEIANLKAFIAEEVQEKYNLQKESRHQQFGELYSKVHDELKKRDFSDISTDKLFTLYLKSNEYIKDEINQLKFLDDAEIQKEKRYRNLFKS